ncbi:Alpha/beta hydrolase family protein [Pseudoalteromonas sp. P1-26]|uniref:alpha/beta hydrolase n=1 Tax=Pseudoalteromonas sp. P1-26 TaxID=1723759 RepID=UPI0006D67F98|nr:alpha/beta hydrolase [Pseudoalteromonas sp. P1-26]KPZ66930.1 Alpha/beta hydrolase family protein [Pseudoalteromonas sp. P1-26]
MKIFKYGEDSQQYCQLFRPDNKQIVPVLIVIHGGYWKDSHSLDSYATKRIVEYFADKGIAVWNVEYRRMNAFGDNHSAPWPTSLLDVAMAVDYLKTIERSEYLDLENITIVGHSAGGHLATWCASRKNINKESPLYHNDPLKIKHAISISGVVDLRRSEDLGQPEQVTKLLSGNNFQIASRLRDSNPLELLDSKVNYHFLHGTEDEEVSINQLSSIEQNSNILIDRLKGKDHFNFFPGFTSDLRCWNKITDLIQSTLT